MSPQELEGKCKELSILVQHWEQLVLIDGILYRRYENNQGKIHTGKKCVESSSDFTEDF